MACTALARAVAFAALLCLPLASHAIFRAYVSSAGSDLNPCTLQQPCRLLPKALTVVDEGGEIWMMDSANYNTATVTVSKSVTILAIPGAVGSVVAPTDLPAIDVTAINAKVALKNLVIVPLGAQGASQGIRVAESAAGAHVRVESVNISGVGTGIELLALGDLTVIDSIVQRGVNGIVARRGRAVVSRCRLIANDNVGLAATMASSGLQVVVHVEETLAAQNGGGFVVSGGSTGLPATLHVRNSVASANNDSGFFALGLNGSAVLYVSGSASNGNAGYGFQATGGNALIRSAGDNRAEGNTAGKSSGAFEPTTPL